MRPAYRRVVAGFLAANYLLCLIGVPLPIAVEKDTSRAYPCQDHQCGCASADACWHHCCCMTREQKLAWALAHNVSPPSEFFREESAEQPGKCCSQTPRGQVASATPATAGAAKHNCCTSREQKAGGNASRRDGSVVVLAAMGCRGLVSVWLSLSTAVIREAEWQFTPAPQWEPLLAPADPHALCVFLAPDPPPPRG